MKPLFTPAGSKAQAVFMNAQNVPTVTKSNTAVKMTETEMNRVRDLKKQLDGGNLMALSGFCGNVFDALGKISDDVLAHSTIKDLDFLGESMTMVLTGTASVNFQSLNTPKSRVPVIGKVIDRLKNVKAKVAGQYQLVSEQIAKRLTEVDVTIKNLVTLESKLVKMYDANLVEYRELQLHSFAAKARYEEIDAETEAFAKNLNDDSDPFDHQQVADARRYLTNLQMTIATIETLQLEAYQTAQMIRDLQQIAVRMVDKFGMIKKYTFPNWKKKFAVVTIGNTFQQAAVMANTIDDANNQLARDTARTIRETGVAVAKLSQRGVYDLETLEFVQNEILTGAQEVRAAVDEGIKKRNELMARAAQMKLELQSTTMKAISK